MVVNVAFITDVAMIRILTVAEVRDLQDKPHQRVFNALSGFHLREKPRLHCFLGFETLDLPEWRAECSSWKKTHLVTDALDTDRHRLFDDNRGNVYLWRTVGGTAPVVKHDGFSNWPRQFTNRGNFPAVEYCLVKLWVDGSL